MSGDGFTEVTTKSWFSRLTESVGGIIFGVLLILIAFPLLFWNEGRAVQRYKTLEEGAGAVVTISPETVDAANEGKLVHLSGMATTDEQLSDPQFGVTAQALKLQRTVEMYQWEEQVETETDTQVGGGETTEKEYSYHKVWSDDVINSNTFKQPGGHTNPGTMPYESQEYRADTVTLGAYTLSSGLVGKISAYEPLAVSEVPAAMQGQVQIANSGYYLGSNPQAPEIGDVRISYEVVNPTTVSLVAQQVGSSFQPYQAQAGGNIELLKVGTHSADEMFEAAQQANTMLTWGLRLAGLLMMTIGFSLVFKPLSVVFDIIPFLGNVVEAGTGFLAFLLALAFSSITIAIGWIFYRPLIAITLLVLAGAAIAAAVFYGRSRAKAKQAA